MVRQFTLDERASHAHNLVQIHPRKVEGEAWQEALQHHRSAPCHMR